MSGRGSEGEYQRPNKARESEQPKFKGKKHLSAPRQAAGKAAQGRSTSQQSCFCPGVRSTCRDSGKGRQETTGIQKQFQTAINYQTSKPGSVYRGKCLRPELCLGRVR